MAVILDFPPRPYVRDQQEALGDDAMSDTSVSLQIEEILKNLLEQVSRTDAAVVTYQSGMTAIEEDNRINPNMPNAGSQ